MTSQPSALTPPQDEVDNVVAAWRTERPDLTTEPMEVFSRISRLARHLDLARRVAFADSGLETWEFDVLSSLRRAGSPYQLTPGRLLSDSLVSSGTMTNRLDRLEEKGLVYRSPSATDGRVVVVTITAVGIEKVDAALEALLAREETFLADLAGETRTNLASALRTISLLFDQGNKTESR